MNQIPLEVMYIIFEKLNIKSMLNIAHTNKYMRQIIKHYIKNRYDSKTNIIIRRMNKNDFIKFMNEYEFRNISVFQLTFDDGYRITNKDIMKQLNCIQLEIRIFSLEKIYLNYFKYLTKCRNLTLSCHRVKELTYNYLSQCTQIKQLSLYLNNEYDKKEVEQMYWLKH